MQLAAPTITPPGPPPTGAPLVLGSTITITAAPATAQIYYTKDGSVPACTANVCTGSLYNGAPVQITFSAGTTETITAIAHDPTGAETDSLPAVAIYTEELPEAGTLPPVTFSQQSSTQNNDFPLGLSDTPGANICYSVDGVTTPTCTAAGTCISPALTYNQILQINGSLPPNPATGSVTVTAIACAAGETPSTSVSQTFILQVAQPTMSLAGNAVPAGTGVQNVPWPTAAAGLTPTIQSATQNSIVVTDPVALWYTFGTTTPPTCTTGNGGLSVTNPTTFNGVVEVGNNATPPLQTTNQTYQVIGCKQGYLPSTVNTFPLTIQMNAPVLNPTLTYPFAFSLSQTAAPNGITVATGGTPGISDAANSISAAGGAGTDWLCASYGATAAACGATANSCGTGDLASIAAGSATGVPVPAATNPSTTASTIVNVIDCKLGVNSSKAVTATYTLQYGSPWLLSTNALPATVGPPGLITAGGQPGWDNKVTGAAVTAMTIPNGATLPYGPFTAYTVGDNGGLACTNEQPARAGAAGNFTENYTCNAALVRNKLPDYYCWIKNGTAACGVGGVFGGCAAGTSTNPGGGAALGDNGGAVDNGTAVTSVAGTMNVNANDTISIIGCQTAPVTVGAAVFNSSAPTTVTFSGAGSATAPTIPAPTPNATQQAVVTVTNNDTTAGGSYLCATISNGIATPVAATCGLAAGAGPGKCCSIGANCGTVAGPGADNGTICWGGVAKGWVSAGTNGANCALTPASGTANNNVTFTASWPASVALGTGAAPQAGGQGGVGGNDIGLIQIQNAVLDMVACNPSEQPSPVATATYTFATAPPQLTSHTIGATVGNLNAGGTIGAGTVIDVSTLSNFESTGAINANSMSIHWLWSATGTNATCGSTGAVGPLGIIDPAPVQPEPTAVWFVGPTASNPIGVKNTPLAGSPGVLIVPNTAGAQTLSVIACGENDAKSQIASAPLNVPFTITAAAPTILTDQSTCTPAQHDTTPAASCPANTCWTGANALTLGTLQGIGAANAVCPAVSNWDGVATQVITAPTPGATLCVSINGKPVSCSNGSCTGTGNLTVNAPSASTSATLTVLTDGSGAGCGASANPASGTTCEITSGTTIAATSCSTTLPAPATPATSTVTLNTSPLVFTPGAGTLACNTPVTVTQDIATTATVGAGGATGGEYICYTTNGKTPAEDTNCCEVKTVAGRCSGSSIITNTTGTTCVQVNSNNTSPPLPAGNTQLGAPYSNLAANQTKPTIALTSSAGIIYNTCVPNGSYTNTAAGESGTVAYTVGAYVHSPTLQVDGNLGDWLGVDSALTAGQTFSSQNGEATDTWAPGAVGTDNGANGAQAFFTYDATNAYFALSYCKASSGAFGAAAACLRSWHHQYPAGCLYLARRLHRQQSGNRRQRRVQGPHAPRRYRWRRSRDCSERRRQVGLPVADDRGLRHRGGLQLERLGLGGERQHRRHRGLLGGPEHRRVLRAALADRHSDHAHRGGLARPERDLRFFDRGLPVPGRRGKRDHRLQHRRVRRLLRRYGRDLRVPEPVRGHDEAAVIRLAR